MVEIRRAEQREWELVRSIRLVALRDSPDWFWATYEQEVDRPAEWWREFVGRGAWFVAWENDKPVGLVAAIYDRDLGPLTWQLISMWVAPEARGGGVGAALVDHLKGWARDAGIEALRLDVTEGNDAARRLYERCGFRPTGRTKPHPRDPHLDELEMQVALDAPRGP